MEIDVGNNLEIFKMGSGVEEVIEVNDFQNVSIFYVFGECNQVSLGDFFNLGSSSIFYIYLNGNYVLQQIQSY